MQTGYIDYDKLEEKGTGLPAQDAHLRRLRLPARVGLQAPVPDRAEGRRAAHVRHGPHQVRPASLAMTDASTTALQGRPFKHLCEI